MTYWHKNINKNKDQQYLFHLIQLKNQDIDNLIILAMNKKIIISKIKINQSIRIEKV